MGDHDAKAYIHRLSQSEELPMELLEEMMNGPSPATGGGDKQQQRQTGQNGQQQPPPPRGGKKRRGAADDSGGSPSLSSDSGGSAMSLNAGRTTVETEYESGMHVGLASGSRSAPGSPMGSERKSSSLFVQTRQESHNSLHGSGSMRSLTSNSAPSSPRGWLGVLGKRRGSGMNLMTELEGELSELLERLSRKGLGEIVTSEQRRLKELISRFKVASPVSEKLKATREKLTENILEKQHKLEAELDERAAKLRAQFQKPPFVRLVDKITFTGSVITMMVTLGLMLRAPEWMPAWYTGWVFLLMMARFVMYHQLQFHYFMLDYCYFHQALLLFYLHLYPSSSFLFEVVFALSNGPVAMAIPVWRNSLVFHDLDKVTSLFIHAFPPVVVFTLRWAGNTATHTVCTPGPMDGCAPVSVTRMLILGIVAYGFWQLSYYFKTEHVDKVKLKSNPSIQTSFRWMASKPGRISALILGLGERHLSLWAFMFYQGVYVVLCLLPVAWWFNSQVLNAAFLALLMAISIWNGANFYFEIFAKNYVKRFSALQADPAAGVAGVVDVAGGKGDSNVGGGGAGEVITVTPTIAVNSKTGLKRIVRPSSPSE